MKIKEIIVVEGKEDSRRLKEVFKNVDTIETRGSAINKRTLELIKQAQKDRGVIIFTDPDYPGLRIRNIINQKIPGCKNAYIEKEKAISIKKKKVGIEHCCDQDIIDALDNITVSKGVKSSIEFIDLYELHLVGNNNSKELREYVSINLNLGYNNAKQLFNKVKMFNISKETLKKLVEDYYKKNLG